MSQSDYNIGANPSGLNMRTEINQIFDSILTHNSGSTAPTVTSAFMIWVDISNATYYYVKMRNHDNTAWVTLGIYTVATKTYISYIDGDQTISGVKTFTSSPIVPTPTTTGNIITMDNIIQKTAVGIGYGTGAGGTVTQLTSKSTAVTLNKPSGKITTASDSLAAGATATFQVNNSIVTASDCVYISNSTASAYQAISNYCTNGAFIIKLTNLSGGALAQAVDIEFVLIKGAIS